MVDLLLRAAAEAVVSVYGSIAYPVSRRVISQWRNVPGGTGPDPRRCILRMQTFGVSAPVVSAVVWAVLAAGYAANSGLAASDIDLWAVFLGSICTPLNRAHRPPQRGKRHRQSVARVGLQCRHSRLTLTAA